MLKNSPILILDEATSALDTISELRVQRVLGAAAQGRTTFIIAHRLSTIRNADWILVLKDGALVEQGRYDDLLRLNGVFAQLCFKGEFGIDPSQT
jgi:ABC-type multidrug transport system fused ATPase/permease subunit